MALAQMYEDLRVGDYGLSVNAREQMEKRGISPDDIELALLYPERRHAASFNGTRASYSTPEVTVYTNDRTHTILAVIPTPDLIKLAEGARQQEQLKAAQPAGHEIPDEEPEVVTSTRELERIKRALDGNRLKPRRVLPRQHTHEEYADLAVQHVLDGIHPKLREEITRQVAGDFSRLVVHSPTNVTVLPAR